MRNLALPFTLLAAASMMAFTPLAPKPPVRLAGNWTYQAPELVLKGKDKEGKEMELRCSMRDVTLTFEEKANVLTGFSRGGTLRCAGSPERPVTEDPIANAEVHGDSVVFRIGPFVHRGKVTRNRIQGAITSVRQPATGRFEMTRAR